jgi:hypothetical protein
VIQTTEKSLRDFKTVDELTAEIKRMNETNPACHLDGTWRRRMKKLNQKRERLENEKVK